MAAAQKRAGGEDVPHASTGRENKFYLRAAAWPEQPGQSTTTLLFDLASARGVETQRSAGPAKLFWPAGHACRQPRQPRQQTDPAHATQEKV